jgi:hypothetical protein
VQGHNLKVMKGTANRPLSKELRTYSAHKSELLRRARGKYVLIKGSRIVGTFESELDAAHQGYEQFGNVPFLVKQVVEVEVPLDFTSSLIGV